MKKLINTVAISALAFAAGFMAQAADSPVKNEMRSAWVATVWQLDWPTTVISTTGSEYQIQKQKDEMTRLLDSLSINNMNAINFQIRSRCDAMYKSSYEPWSTDLVSSRGMDPGYDPLQFVVEECHKRGMECHAWINPYRYESQIGQWKGANDYRNVHPDWLLDVGGASILNPGKPEVTQRICDIIAEIVTNYDVDGVLFDDYFYLSGTQNSQDADLYEAYKSAGGQLSQADWRRDNVNRMVAAVYSTIKSIKPYVRFGVAPAGIACTSATVARQYGISPCPTGGDWQYNDIYSDPIAWVSQQTLDFISPQIYWTIGHSTDYDKATKWWSEVANKWNRHMYVSHDIATLNTKSEKPGLSVLESSLMDQAELSPLASGPNNTTFAEYANEIRLNRKYTLNNAPGSIFYSCKYLYKNAPLFAHYLKTTVFNTPALMPPMSWLPVSAPGNVTNVKRSGNILSWDAKSNVRYTVYAVPSSVAQKNFNREPEYLLGVSYTNSFTLPDRYLSGYNYAVCVYDRYGNEYSPVFVGATAGTLAAPVLISPKDGQTIEQPFDFEWKSVTNAANYIIEISDSRDMNSLLYVKAVDGTSCSTSDFYKMPIETPLYWRVRACGSNYDDGVSAVQSFISRNLEISGPEDGAIDQPLNAVIEWSIPERDVTVQIATSETFEDSKMVLESSGTGGKFTVPDYILSYYTTYYVRLLYVRNDESCVTPTVAFTTVEGDCEVPVIKTPVEGATLYKDDCIALNPVKGHKMLRIEVSATTSFPSRSSYASVSVDRMTFTDAKTASEIRLGTASLVDGETYYVRARAQYDSPEGSKNTEYSPVVSFMYSAKTNSVADIAADDSEDNAPAEMFGVDGRQVVNPGSGLYIVRRGNTVTKVIVK